MYNKRTASWYAVPVKENKTYHYIKDLQLRILETRQQVRGPLAQPARLGHADPRLIGATIAATEAPSTEELVQRHASRFAS